MLHTLRIQNYALIDRVEVEFHDGFNVLTGETGAGKSIVVGALNLVLGARVSGDVLRENTAPAKIDALFRIEDPSPRLRQLLETHSLDLEDHELLLSRVLSADGRSKAYAAGNLVTLAVLAAIGDELVDLHGQHEHQSLLKTDRQRDLLDAFAGSETGAARVAALVRDLRALEKTIQELESDDREGARRLEFLRFETREIGQAGLSAGEEDELGGRRNLIANAEKIFTLASSAHRMLFENDEGLPALDALAAAVRDLEALADIDGRFAPLARQIEDARNDVQAVADEVREYTQEVEYDPRELDAVNTRLTLIRDLRRKYGETVEEILAYRDKALAEIDAFENRDKRLAELTEERRRLEAEANGGARVLSKKRRAGARRLDKSVTASLQELGMKGGAFRTHFEPIALSPDGIDKVEFYLAANPGEKPKPLKQVASGGEISRIMLALKAVSARADRIPTLVFDEIDAGVGGTVANKVVEKLRGLARSHQTICITHLPQIAAAAGTHYHVSKTTKKGRTATGVALVEDRSRVEEVARLLDGSLSEVSLDHARTLLAGHP